MDGPASGFVLFDELKTMPEHEQAPEGFFARWRRMLGHASSMPQENSERTLTTLRAMHDSRYLAYLRQPAPAEPTAQVLLGIAERAADTEDTGRRVSDVECAHRGCDAPSDIYSAYCPAHVLGVRRYRADVLQAAVHQHGYRPAHAIPAPEQPLHEREHPRLSIFDHLRCS